MDIKDFILIGGGALIAAVVAHGFWIAWRARRDPLRLDLMPGSADEYDPDELERLRAELPNGGARVIDPAGQPRQESLELGADDAAPVLLNRSEPAGEARSPAARSRKTEPSLGAPHSGGRAAPAARKESAAAKEAAATPAGGREGTAAEQPQTKQPRAEAAAERATRERDETAPAGATRGRRGKVADVIMPERSSRVEEPREPRRWPARKTAEETPRSGRGTVQPPGEGRTAETDVEELIMISVLAPKGSPFTGPGLVETLRARGLRYGDMNIFHRVDPMTRATLYSVANVVEPGTFDLTELDEFRSPGVCFFMQLPGPEQPMDTFEDMLKAARDVAVRMGGELRDEKRSVMTGQTVEHYRQRISDFCRRRMSKRA